MQSQFFAKIFSSSKSSALFRNIVSNVLTDLIYQFRCPTKSLTGFLATHYWTKKSLPLVYAAINEINIQPDDKILEIGFGRGAGIEKVFNIVANGSGSIYGLETSEYMKKCAYKKFALEFIELPHKIVIDNPLASVLMPYPVSFFDGIYHVDTFYFWTDVKLHTLSFEFFRVLKPGKKVVCAMDLARLKKFEDYNLLNLAQIDPIRYLNFMNLTFKDVRIEYRKIDANGNFVSSNDNTVSNCREIQLLLAQKPEEIKTDSPEEQFRQLEDEIREEYFSQSIAKWEYARTKSQNEKFNKMKWAEDKNKNN